MRRNLLIVLCLMLAALPLLPGRAAAQAPGGGLPAPLYILTADQRVVGLDPVTGDQTPLTPVDQPVADFDIAPDGGWLVYRTPANGPLAIVGEIGTGSGYVLDFQSGLPPETAAGPTIAWAGDASAIAYLVPEGVRIARLSGGPFGEPLIDTVPGGPWDAVFWAEEGYWAVIDSAGAVQAVSFQSGTWAAAAPATPPAPPRVPVEASLTEQGVVLGGGEVVPGTAGARAFDWGPPIPEVVEGLVLPLNLYFAAPDASGVRQVWQLPADGSPARAITAFDAPVASYGIAPGQDRVAAVAGDRLVVADFGGANAAEVAQLQTQDARLGVAWSPDGARVAFSDGRGVWVVDADGTQPPRLLAQNNLNMDDILAIRVYYEPQWDAVGGRLLVRVGLYEGAIPGVVDVASGVVTELTGGAGSHSYLRWADEGRILAWSASYGYVMPGLYRIDPAAPAATAQTILDEQYPVYDVRRDEAGGWYVLIGSSAQMGPQLLRVLTGPSLDGPLNPAFGSAAGAYAERPILGIFGHDAEGALIVAGLRDTTYDNQGRVSGTLVIANLSSGAALQVKTPGPASDLRWGGS